MVSSFVRWPILIHIHKIKYQIQEHKDHVNKLHNINTIPTRVFHCLHCLAMFLPTKLPLLPFLPPLPYPWFCHHPSWYIPDAYIASTPQNSLPTLLAAQSSLRTRDCALLTRRRETLKGPSCSLRRVCSSWRTQTADCWPIGTESRHDRPSHEGWTISVLCGVLMRSANYRFCCTTVIPPSTTLARWVLSAATDDEEETVAGSCVRVTSRCESGGDEEYLWLRWRWWRPIRPYPQLLFWH